MQTRIKQEHGHHNSAETQRPRSRIVDAIQQTARRQSAEEELSYSDYCDWHDTCDCNE